MRPKMASRENGESRGMTLGFPRQRKITHPKLGQGQALPGYGLKGRHLRH